ncbi:MAG: DMT family transporter [Sphingopyxis sp.]|nr:DMT family transporter [Sphingopyxis sp.]
MSVPAAPAPTNMVGGIALRLVAMLGLSLMFVVVKLVADRGIHLVESLFWRQAFALPFVFAWALTHGGIAILKTDRLAAHSRRAAMGLGGMAMNFGGMILLPMAEATTISLSVPIFATIFAAILLGEPTGRARWSAVVLGFVGVLLVVQPGGSGFDSSHLTGALVALGGAVMTALITIAVRDLGRTETAVSIVFWFSFLSLIPLGLALPFVVQSHSPAEWGLLVLLGLSGAIVQMCLTGALRLAPVSVVIPMDYSSLLWAIAFGWWFFGTLPAASTWLGAPIIIASGLFIAWREHVKAVARAKEVAA